MNKRQIAEEELKRALLMMKYDSRKTLTENINSNQLITEIIPAAFLTIPWLTTYGIAAASSIGAWIYNTSGGGDAFAKTQAFFQGCNSNTKNLKPTLGKSEHRAAADKIYNAIEGVGTTLNDIKSAFSEMTTVADICAMYQYYNNTYGDLYDDLDSDIDGEDFRKYAWSAIAPQVADAEEELNKVQANPETTDGKKTEDGKKTVYTGGSYKACTGTYTQGCKSEAIKKVQGCLGLVADGKFGPKTQKALTAKGFTGGFTDADVDKICKVQASPEPKKDAIDMSVDTGRDVADNNIAP